MRKIILILLPLLLIGCGGRKSNNNEQKSVQKTHFRRVMPPMQASPEDQFSYMVEHYWDKFDFSDTLFIERVDSAEMALVFAEYISNFVGPYN
ncbi:MAG: DUF5106 domain-containing protein, partial [Alistipes sp.]|nr:DUF5106 domain-containing protein [Alistipes sp.]